MRLVEPRRAVSAAIVALLAACAGAACDWAASRLSFAAVTTVSDITRLMVEGSIGRRMEMTVWRNGALVDVVVEPRELQDA